MYIIKIDTILGREELDSLTDNGKGLRWGITQRKLDVGQ